MTRGGKVIHVLTQGACAACMIVSMFSPYWLNGILFLAAFYCGGANALNYKNEKNRGTR